MIQDIFALKIFRANMIGYETIRLETSCAIEAQVLEKGTRYITGVTVLQQQDLNQDLVPNIKNIFQFIDLNIKYYWQQLGYKGRPRLKYHWANVNFPDGATLMHDHAPSPLAGCFYVDVPENSGDLFLANPLEILLRYQPFEEQSIRHNEFPFDHRIEVSNGMLVMWPGYLVHRSGTNHSGKNRVLIGFDVDFEE